MKPSLLFILLGLGVLGAQEASRQIWDTGFLQKRPASPQATTRPPNSAPPVQYRTNASPAPMTQTLEPVVGLTLWRLRSATAADTVNSRLLLQDVPNEPSSAPFIPERVNLSEPLHEGDRIRISVESPRSGFLYIIDRERYSDGSTGEPYLIFPAGNFSFGMNDIQPGRVLEIPPQNSKAPALKVTRHGDRHIGEELSIVITKERIPDLTISDRETKLSPELVERWNREWAVTPTRLDLTNDEHAAWTSVEKEAGSGQRLLTQADPMPATILTANPEPGKPLLLHIDLYIRNR